MDQNVIQSAEKLFIVTGELIEAMKEHGIGNKITQRLAQQIVASTEKLAGELNLSDEVMAKAKQGVAAGFSTQKMIEVLELMKSGLVFRLGNLEVVEQYNINETLIKQLKDIIVAKLSDIFRIARVVAQKELNN